jgi:glucose-1-phosphate thymidylyltransferase
LSERTELEGDLESDLEIVGVLPAAGLGSRLHPFYYPKELLTIAYEAQADGGVQPVLATEFGLRALAAAGARRCVVIIADWKLEIVRCLPSDDPRLPRLAYVKQGAPTGSADAVGCILDWIVGASACLVLPDTVFRPVDAVTRICDALRGSGADLVLGVFPTTKPEQLGPVTLGPQGRVLEVVEKPARPAVANTWGMAAWRPTFSNLFAELRRDPHRRPNSIGEVFNEAVKAGLDVRAVEFADGSYFDLGTADNLRALFVESQG